MIARVRRLQESEFDEWLRLRQALWPDSDASELGDELTAIWAGREHEPVFVAERLDGGLAGMIEVSLHETAAGCTTCPVGYIEGWYVFQPRTIIAIDNGVRTLIVGLIPILYWSGLLELGLLFLLTFLAHKLEPATTVGSRSILADFVEDWRPDTPMETTLLQRNVLKAQLGRVFGAHSSGSQVVRRLVWPLAACCWLLWLQRA